MQAECLWGVDQHGGVREHEVHELVPEDASDLEMRVIDDQKLSISIPDR